MVALVLEIDMQKISVCKLLCYTIYACMNCVQLGCGWQWGCAAAIGLHLMWGLLLHAHSVYLSVEWNWSEQCN